MAWNVFRFYSGLHILGYVMIFLVASIISLSYYAIIILECGSLLRHGGTDSVLVILLIAVFHLLLLMLLWSYFMAAFTGPGSVPQNCLPLAEENPGLTSSTDSAEYAFVENWASSWPSSGKAAQGSGARLHCHHCLICQRCVLKMDHHCIWVVNCVDARNYKFLLLFLLYTLLEMTLDMLVLLPHPVHHVLWAVLNLVFALSLLGFSISHSSLLLSNTTTIEVDLVLSIPANFLGDFCSCLTQFFKVYEKKESDGDMTLARERIWNRYLV